jgi:hypothetical protein
MPIDERWAKLTDAEWDDFAEAWLREIRGSGSEDDAEIGQRVVLMSFTASPESQWTVLVKAVVHAQSEEELGHIAAGPLEHLLGKHGASMIDRVERLAATDGKFARMLTGAWRNMMSDSVWQRLQAIQAGVQSPLRTRS